MNILSLKTLLFPVLLAFLMASCAKTEVAPPRAESNPVNVLKGGEDDYSPVKVTVLNSAQSPVVGATVTIYDGATVIATGSTNSSGYCELLNITHASYNFEIVASGYEALNEAITVTSTVNRRDELVEL